MKAIEVKQVFMCRELIQGVPIAKRNAERTIIVFYTKSKSTIL